MNKKDTAIIFGTSPFISELGCHDINYLINKYTTIGINTFGIHYPNIEYWIWSDYNMYNWVSPYLDNQKIIISEEVHRREILPTGNNLKIKYIFDGSANEISHNLDNNKLLMFKTTAHPAINYMYLNGFKNIILCGVDLVSEWNHFDNDGKCFRTPKRIEQIRERLYKFKEHVNLYTLNQNSDLDINKINIKEL